MPSDSVYLTCKYLREAYRDGKLTDEQISRLRAIHGFRFEVLPVKKHSVVCFETGERFETIAEVARKFGVSKGCAQQRIKKHRPIAPGVHIFYEEELPKELPESDSRNCHKNTQGYICLETGETYESIKSIAEKFDVSYKAVESAIKRHGSPGRCGLHFYRADENPDSISFKNDRRKILCCVETGMVFSDAGAAGRWLGREAPRYNNIYKALKTGGVAYGYHWEYADDKAEEGLGVID